MSFLKTVAAALAACAFALSWALADDHDPTMSMVSMFEVKPSKEKQFDDAWMEIKRIAEANEYPFTEMAGGWRNTRWIVTPINKFADVDAVMEARDAVEEAGGRKFEKAIDKFNDALTDSHTFFTHYDDELSYRAEGDVPGPYMKIDSFYYQHGKREEAKAVLADYKALMESMNAPYSHQVNWDGIGTPGNSFTIITYAEDAVAMAEREAAEGEMLRDNETWQSIFARYQEIATKTNMMVTNFNADASINFSMGGEE